MSKNDHYDVAVVGAGIVGVANAWMAARQGNTVVLLERDPHAQRASVRNFGMVWPIGQPLGERYATAMRSRELWLEISQEADIWCNPCGSIHLAHHEDEWAVLHEFADLANQAGAPLELLAADAVCRSSPATIPEGLLGGLYSGAELCVNPVKATEQATQWLTSEHGVDRKNGQLVIDISGQTITTSSAERLQADRMVVCSGADFQTLYPDIFQQSGLRRCQLQMLATGCQPQGWTIGPHLATGLTLRHYDAFVDCPTLAAVKHRIAENQPDLDQFGIHVLASQNDAGEVILGDSHLYDDQIGPFSSERIDELILQELKKRIRLPDFQIQRRWTGVYSKTIGDTHFEYDVTPQIKIVTGLGGTE